jgi:hypothetical protein
VHRKTPFTNAAAPELTDVPCEREQLLCFCICCNFGTCWLWNDVSAHLHCSVKHCQTLATLCLWVGAAVSVEQGQGRVYCWGSHLQAKLYALVVKSSAQHHGGLLQVIAETATLHTSGLQVPRVLLLSKRVVTVFQVALPGWRFCWKHSTLPLTLADQMLIYITSRHIHKLQNTASLHCEKADTLELCSTSSCTQMGTPSSRPRVCTHPATG